MTAKKAKIVLVTRTKNRNILLKRALESVESQSYGDYIHVVVNDGGDRKSVDNLLANYKNDRRIVIHNKESKGLTQALNQGINAVDTEYIAILDDDDSLHPDRLKMVVEFLELHPGAACVVHVMDRVIESIQDDKVVEKSRDRWYGGVTDISLYKQCLDNYMTNGAVTYTRSVYDELGGYDESLDVAEDWDFGLRVLLRYDIDFLNTKHPLSYYHHRPKDVGEVGNSVFAGVDKHKHALNALRNRYLRKDINNGVMGVGYIMNNLHHDREIVKEQDKKAIDNIIRVESHMNHVAEDIKNTPSTIFQKILKRTKRFLK